MRLRWSPEVDAIAEVARDRGFAAPTQVAGMDGEASLEGLAAGLWFWRVRSPSRGNSPIWSFRVGGSLPSPALQSVVHGSDFDGDGRDDLLFRQAARLGSGLMVRLLTGDATCIVSTTPGAKEGFCENLGPPLAAGDVDGDGFDDAVAVIRHQDQSQVLFYRGHSELNTNWLPSPVGCLDPPSCDLIGETMVRLGDVDGDGFADLGEPRGRIFRGSRNGPQRARSTTLPRYAAIVGGGDIDGDSIHEIAGRRDRNAICLHRGAAAGPSREPTHCVSTADAEGAIPNLAIAELDGDGRADVLGGGVGERAHLWWMRGQPDLARMQPTTRLSWPFESHRDEAAPYLAWTVEPRWGPSPARIIVVDDPSPSNELFEIRLEGSNLIPKPTPRLDGDYAERRPSSIGDVDGDGWPDVLITMTTAVDGTWSWALIFGRPDSSSTRREQRIWHVPFTDTVFPKPLQ